MIDVSHLSPAAVLAALYNASRPQGFGIMHFTPENMTEEEATAILGGRKSARFDYLKGRVLKVEINGRDVDPYLYDRDNGAGAAERAISSIEGH